MKHHETLMRWEIVVAIWQSVKHLNHKNWNLLLIDPEEYSHHQCLKIVYNLISKGRLY